MLIPVAGVLLWALATSTWGRAPGADSVAGVSPLVWMTPGETVSPGDSLTVWFILQPNAAWGIDTVRITGVAAPATAVAMTRSCGGGATPSDSTSGTTLAGVSFVGEWTTIPEDGRPVRLCGVARGEGQLRLVAWVRYHDQTGQALHQVILSPGVVVKARDHGLSGYVQVLIPTVVGAVFAGLGFLLQNVITRRENRRDKAFEAEESRKTATLQVAEQVARILHGEMASNLEAIGHFLADKPKSPPELGERAMDDILRNEDYRKYLKHTYDDNYLNGLDVIYKLTQSYNQKAASFLVGVGNLEAVMAAGSALAEKLRSKVSS